MAHRIRDVEIVNYRLDPHEPELRILVDVEELTPTTEIRGRLMGPRCAYRSTVEVAYSLREVARGNRFEMRVTIPEASWWEPKMPFLYEGPLELWQDGIRCDQRGLRHGIRNLQMTSNGLKLNGRPYCMCVKAVETRFDEALARQWHEDGINAILTSSGQMQDADLNALADRFGFFVMDDDGFASLARLTSDIG